MWFRPGQHNESDRFRVSSIRNRIRRRKSTTNTAKKQNVEGSSGDATDNSNGCPSIDVPSHDVENVGVHVPASGPLRSASGRRLSLHTATNHRTVIDPNAKTEKEKVLLNDRKFKSNRVTKSSSKSKIGDLIDKTQNNVKSAQLNSGSARKISAPTTLDATATNSKTKSARSNANLNLNALLRYKSFISGSTKKLTHEDFDRLRRKSLGENGKLNGRRMSGAEKKQSKYDKNGTSIEHSCNEFTDDETFHSCNDDDDDAKSSNGRHSRNASPSLTSRVAARFTDGVHKRKAAAAKQKSDRRKASCYCYPTAEGCYHKYSIISFYILKRFHQFQNNLYLLLFQLFAYTLANVHSFKYIFFFILSLNQMPFETII